MDSGFDGGGTYFGGEPQPPKKISPKDKIKDGKELITIGSVIALLSLCLSNTTLMLCSLLISAICLLDGIRCITIGRRQLKEEQERADNKDQGGAQ